METKSRKTLLEENRSLKKEVKILKTIFNPNTKICNACGRPYDENEYRDTWESMAPMSSEAQKSCFNKNIKYCSILCSWYAQGSGSILDMGSPKQMAWREDLAKRIAKWLFYFSKELE